MADPVQKDSDFDGNEDFWEVAGGGSPRSPVDDFRRIHPEIEINIQEPLPPFHPGSTGSGSGSGSAMNEQPLDQAPSYEQPSYEEPSYDVADEPVVAVDDPVEDFSEFA